MAHAEAGPFDLIQRFGIEVIESETLVPPGVLFREYGIALVRRSLDRAGRLDLADQILAALASEVPASPRQGQ